MKARIGLLISAIAAAYLGLAGCGDGSSSVASSAPPPPPVVQKMDLDTAAVLAIVQTKTSETTEPFQVNGGAVVVTPVGDETSEPISVTAQ